MSDAGLALSYHRAAVLWGAELDRRTEAEAGEDTLQVRKDRTEEVVWQGRNFDTESEMKQLFAQSTLVVKSLH
jgi:hypothetical protein